MNKRRDLLDLLKSYTQLKEDEAILSSKIHREEITKLLLKIQQYYKLKDIETDSNDYEIFTKLYIDSENFSFDQISKECNVSVRTLDRYRQEYSKFAQKLLDLDEGD